MLSLNINKIVDIGKNIHSKYLQDLGDQKVNENL